ncbi:hypothetical protein HU200_055899 [Digitaria exilis]|uniref:B box-type domain-containing protein n=1 Tax=Digitaria exilis TaxID=1010633 RepID=A0A835AFN3_9POAL|nr:hypothetical protein HU200_055899 [Digitaria exilis]CAB3475850.1 unnamed protein product [Digitaria exilis]
MKVLCSACEAAEARVLCCADEAALCALCDRDVHAANRLAGKHHRLPLHPSASSPDCDICQESHAYFFCVEDRALLCRSCDVAVHTANAFVSGHRRFLLTGVHVGPQPDAQETDPHPHTPNAAAPAPPPNPPPAAKKARSTSSPAPLYYSDDEIDVGITGNLPDWQLVDEQLSAPPVPGPPAEPVVTRVPSKRKLAAAPFTVQGGLAGGMPDWPLDDFFDGFSEFTAGLGFTENGTSKADSGKLGSNDGSPTGRTSSDSAQDMFGQVPEFHQWSVPELIPSPPTASGLHWHGGAAAVSVPDISSPENPFRCFAADAGQPQPAAVKRRRRC